MSKTWIALFRGINVGGNSMLPMKSLVALVEACGCADVQTYIQSGNAVFRSRAGNAETLAARIGRAVHKAHGFEPRILLLSCDELQQAVDANPFPHAERDHKTLHLYFLAAKPTAAKLTTLEELKLDESFVLKDRIFYLHSPRGLAKSKVAERVERLLGVAATARNWRTCITVLGLAKSLSS